MVYCDATYLNVSKFSKYNKCAKFLIIHYITKYLELKGNKG